MKLQYQKGYWPLNAHEPYLYVVKEAFICHIVEQQKSWKDRQDINHIWNTSAPTT